MSESDLRKDYEKQMKKVVRKCRRDAKLEELEKQLEFAESRCGSLKQQLDYIKMLYKGTRDANLEKQFGKTEGHIEGAAKQYNCQDCNNQVAEQNENVMYREDGDGPALLKQMSHSTTMTTTSSNNKFNSQDMNDLKKKSSRTGGKMMKTKKKTSRKVKKRRRLNSVGTSSKISNASSQTQTPTCHDALVEIYKSAVANAESESGLELLGRNKLHKSNEAFKRFRRDQKTTGKHVDEVKAKSCMNLSPKIRTALEEDVQKVITTSNEQEKKTEIEYPNEENVQKTENLCYASVKNYSKPTISSTRKQIARNIYSNINNLNIRNFPFVAARSTAPSHNIGVNIQQVLSVIKKRHPINENLLNISANGNQENPVTSLMSSRNIGMKTNGSVSAPVTGISGPWEPKQQIDRPKTSMSYWKSNSEINKGSALVNEDMEKANAEWNSKIEKLKKVLVFLHEDFTSLSHKYKRLQKKLTKRNITKMNAKDELASIERSLEKKEEEITVVIILYKEVMNLREALKKLQEKYNIITSGKNFLDGFRQSSSTHTQMTNLLRKIQDLQTKLKG